MAGEYPLAPWIAQSNTDLMPRAMVAGAQAGNVIADNRRANAQAQFAAQEAEAKRVQEAMRYQGFQDYQRDIANGMDAGKALAKHGAKMYFGQTVFPTVMNAMERNVEAARYHDQLDTYRKEREANDKLNDAERNRIADVGRKIQADTLEAKKIKDKQDADLAIQKNIQAVDQFKQKFGEDTRQFEITNFGKEADRDLRERQFESKTYAPSEVERKLREAEKRGVKLSQKQQELAILIGLRLEPGATKDITPLEFKSRFFKMTKTNMPDATDAEIGQYLGSLYNVFKGAEDKSEQAPSAPIAANAPDNSFKGPVFKFDGTNSMKRIQ